MGESMRGSRLGTTSYEVDSGEYAPRALTTYVCDQGHRITMPFSVEADEIPTTWPLCLWSHRHDAGSQT